MRSYPGNFNWCIKGEDRGSARIEHPQTFSQPNSYTTDTTMDFFASLPVFAITSNIPVPEHEPSTPIDADFGGGAFGGCFVA